MQNLGAQLFSLHRLSEIVRTKERLSMQTFMGLPWHALFVHFAVSFLCLFALGALTHSLSRWIKNYD